MLFETDNLTAMAGSLRAWSDPLKFETVRLVVAEELLKAAKERK